MNETLSWTEDIEAPRQLQPLDRHGVSIKHLTELGVEQSGIAQIYRSLFVYSSGFYETILSVLEGTGHKNRLATGFWTVFAILLESCGHSDYQMMSAGNTEEAAEHQEEVETLRQEHERTQETLKLANNELKAVQKDLQREIRQREGMQAELLLKRTRYQDEVSARMLFESKINLICTTHREMKLKTTQLVETVKVQKRQLGELLEALKGQSTENAGLKHLNIGLEQEVNRLLATTEHLEKSY